MENKKLITIIVSIILVIIVSFILFKISQPKEYEYFTKEPETWVEPGKFTEPKNDVRINVFKATAGKSTFSINKQEFPGDDKAFNTYGIYNGKYFEINHTEQEKKIIELSQTLDPDDGTMQAFILAKEDDFGYVFYLFIDEDWRQDSDAVNVIYGMDFNNQATLIQREFNPEQISPGVYVDVIADYNGWYDQNPIAGGIMLGDITLNELTKDEVNSTFIILR